MLLNRFFQRLLASPCSVNTASFPAFHFTEVVTLILDFSSGSLVKNLPVLQKIYVTWILSLGWEDLLETGHGNPLQYSGLENPMDRGA